MSSCTSSHTWCYATSCRLALPSHTWCYATSCRLALPHIHNATLLYEVLHFLTYMMLRYFMSSCTPIAFLEELKQLLKQWGKEAMKCCFAVVWNNAKWGTSKNIEFFCWKCHFVPRPSIKRVPSYRNFPTNSHVGRSSPMFSPSEAMIAAYQRVGPTNSLFYHLPFVPFVLGL